MVVSGHQFTIGEIAFLGGSIIGICTKQMNSGSVDAAYIEITDDSFGSPINTMCNTTSSILSTRLGFPGAGTFVNKRGQKTGRIGGTITSTNATFSNGIVLVQNLTLADYESENGDSGSPVYTLVRSTNTLFTVGVHKGSGSNDAYFSKADLVLSELGLTRY